MSKRNTKETRHKDRTEEDDIELHDTFDAPIKAGKESSPYDIPREDRAAAAHTFSSDVDQQKMLAQISSEVAALREEVRSLSKRVDKLERGQPAE
jgi:hypothetical protein